MEKFGDRMKQYENAFRHYLPRRMPVIIRIDGSHFSSYTKDAKKPFDIELAEVFWETCKYLTENIAGCQLAYHQSDEISLLLTDYQKLTTEAWFNNNLQKLVSVSASMATAKFNNEMRKRYPDKELATFDARAWILPQDEVCNYFLWRQQDATKNSVSMVAQSEFKHNELQGLNGPAMKEKLLRERGIEWEHLPVWQKRGVCIVKQCHMKGDVQRSTRAVDHETPIFSQRRDYIEQYVYF